MLKLKNAINAIKEENYDTAIKICQDLKNLEITELLNRYNIDKHSHGHYLRRGERLSKDGFPREKILQMIEAEIENPPRVISRADWTGHHKERNQ